MLSDLLSESEGMREGRQVQEFEPDENRKQLADQSRGFIPFEECELVGFEFRNATECNEVFEVECGPANVTKYRTELVDKCKTVIDRKCDLRMIEVPQQKCQERLQNKYNFSKLGSYV